MGLNPDLRTNPYIELVLIVDGWLHGISEKVPPLHPPPGTINSGTALI